MDYIRVDNIKLPVLVLSSQAQGSEAESCSYLKFLWIAILKRRPVLAVYAWSRPPGLV